MSRQRVLKRWVSDDFGERRVYRRCTGCRSWLTPDEFPARRHAASPGEVIAVRRSRCKACERQRARDRRGRSTIEERRRKYRHDAEVRRLQADRERQREYERRARERRDARDPEWRSRESKLYRQRMKRDPVRHAAFLEGRRIQTRLKREREGVSLDEMRSGVAVMAREAPIPLRPAAPLRAFVLAFATREDLPLETLLDRVGVSTRSYRRWGVAGASVRATEIDKVLTELGVNEWDVWDA